MWSLHASTGVFMNPRVSDIVRDRSTTTMGSFATRTVMRWCRTASSIKRARASVGTMNMQ
jgi:hypothetical protein